MLSPAETFPRRDFLKNYCIDEISIHHRKITDYNKLLPNWEVQVDDKSWAEHGWGIVKCVSITLMRIVYFQSRL